MIAENRIEWVITDIALLQVGAIPVPIYPTMSANEYLYIFEHAEICTAFVSNQELYGRIAHLPSQISHLNDIISFEKMEGAIYWEDLLTQSEAI